MIDPRKVRVACISDSPKLTTGFGIVAKELYDGMYNYGLDLSVFGLLDVEPDERDILPYPFTPVTGINLMGHNTVNGQLMYSLFLRRVRPNVIFLLTSPGNAKDFMNGIYDGHTGDWKRNGVDYTPPVVLYTPIEGRPQHNSNGLCLAKVQAIGGRVVAYCHSAKKQMAEEFPGIEAEIVMHGHDHAPFERYSDEDRKLLRKMVGIDDYFVVGAVGTNKRTKNHVNLIYTARHLRDTGKDKGILFYLHTDATVSQMDGLDLLDLSERYGVRDMFLFKPDDMIYRNHPYKGAPYFDHTLEQVKKETRIPRTKSERGYLFGHYDLISRYNCMDLYVDVSQVEGWGLPPCEAMMCGVATVSVHDNSVRSEIHSQGAHMIFPVEERVWETWHTGSRLLQVDPAAVAEVITTFKDLPKLKENVAERGLQAMKKFRWEPEAMKMAKIIHEVAEANRG